MKHLKEIIFIVYGKYEKFRHEKESKPGPEATRWAPGVGSFLAVPGGPLGAPVPDSYSDSTFYLPFVL